VTKLRERISTSKRARQKFDLQRFDPRKLSIEVKEKYKAEISNISVALENLDESLYINSAGDCRRKSRISQTKA
jgi:hypothetical protein